MSARDAVLGTIRRSLGVADAEGPRAEVARQRLALRPRGLIPARGKLDGIARIHLFRDQVQGAGASIELLIGPDAVPGAVAAVLRGANLPMRVRLGADRRLAAMPWGSVPTLEVAHGPSDGSDLVGVSHAAAAVAESGTVVLLSGPDNPTTLNFLPENHLVVVSAADIAGDYETVWDRLRRAGPLPRAVNWITGPSRSADIEQKLIMGAHGPRRLHVLVVG